jgi:hypothetical protein
MYLDAMNKKNNEWDLMMDAVSLKGYKNLSEIEDDVLTALNCTYDDEWFKEEFRLIVDFSTSRSDSAEDMCTEIIDKYVYGGSKKIPATGISTSINLENFEKDDNYLNEHELLDASGEALDATREEIINGNIFVFIQEIIEKFTHEKIKQLYSDD